MISPSTHCGLAVHSPGKTLELIFEEIARPSHLRSETRACGQATGGSRQLAGAADAKCRARFDWADRRSALYDAMLQARRSRQNPNGGDSKHC